MSERITRLASPLPLPFSRAVQAGGFAFLSGVLALDNAGRPLDGDIALQTRAVIEQIEATLDRCGARLTDIVKVTVWLSDLADFGKFNVEYARHFSADLQARSTVQAQLYAGAKAEIKVQALMPWDGPRQLALRASRAEL